MLKLYEVDPITHEKACVAYLGDAYEVELEQRINDIESLYFSYPYTDEKAPMIQENMIVSCEGRDYVTIKVKRKTKGSDIVEVTAIDLFYAYGIRKHIQNIPDMIGVKPSAVFEKILEGSGLEMFTEAELQERGMTWVDSDGYLIDFFSVDKTNVWEATKTLIENCGKGELYRDNMKVAIVKQIGQDNGVRLTLEKNLDGLDIMRDFESTITRLYPYGAEDMHIGSVNGGKQYIDSPMIEKYGIIEGYRDYSDYTDPEKIKAHAEWEFSPDNENRIDIPELKITGGFIDLAKLPEFADIEKVEIGDTVHVYDNDHNVYHQRIVALKSYPYEPKMPEIEIGHMNTDFFSLFYNLCHRRKELEAVQTTNKQITTRKMQGVVNTDRNGVQSDNELLKIVGDLLTIRDKNKKLRANLGNVGEEFAFELYDEKGNCNVYINDDGDIVIAGTLDTGKDCRIQGDLRVGMAGSSMKGITFYGDSYQPDADGNYSTPYARILPWVDAYDDHTKGINVTGGKLCVEGSPVITKTYVDKLETDIEILTEKYNNLKKQLDTMS